MYCIQTAEDIVFLSLVAYSSFFYLKRQYTIPRGNLSARRKIHEGGKNLRFSTEIAVYLGNGTR